MTLQWTRHLAPPPPPPLLAASASARADIRVTQPGAAQLPRAPGPLSHALRTHFGRTGPIRRLRFRRRVMLHNSRPTLADISCSALVPRLSPPGSLSLDDLSHLAPATTDELSLAVRTDVSSDGASSCSDLGVGGKTHAELERRKRRRENNKAAAAKCRKKKKDRAEYLLQESEKLESVNINLKAQIKALNQQKQHLSYMLNQHRPTCIVHAQNGRTPDDDTDLFVRHLQESQSSIFALRDSASSIFDPPELDPAGGLLSLDHVQCSVSM
ncbi:cyclic AMP-dependent transcription factor ATF-3 isoform X3 [Phyllopteryx taeniolatus]|uniref:cyclic AMP-dependent transcription factor ATF-3 isoform X3 n=1 Tax=Phyllopteryx taeniolatus TaxID=161469 RepID=UPI002AD4D34C|nr:cyclic AMP-dependent transcription factor ATF-3 isoform X3 [Phyllopteryx taeniolatus]